MPFILNFSFDQKQNSRDTNLLREKLKRQIVSESSPILRTALALGLQCIQRMQENVDICFEKFTCVSIRRTWLDEKHWCRKIFHYFAEAHLKNIYCYWNTLESLSKFQKSHIEWHLCNVFWFSQLQAVMSETRHGYHGWCEKFCQTPINKHKALNILTFIFHAIYVAWTSNSSNKDTLQMEESIIFTILIICLLKIGKSGQKPSLNMLKMSSFK